MNTTAKLLTADASIVYPVTLDPPVDPKAKTKAAKKPLHHRVAAALAKSNPTEARSIVAKAVALGREDLVVLRARAALAAHDKDWRTLTDLVAQAAKIAEKPLVWLQRYSAIVELSNKDWSAAGRAAEAGLVLAPKDAKLHSLRLRAAIRSGDESVFMAAIESAVTMLPKEPEMPLADAVMMINPGPRLTTLLVRMESGWVPCRLAEGLRRTQAMTNPAQLTSGSGTEMELLPSRVALDTVLGNAAARASGLVELQAELDAMATGGDTSRIIAGISALKLAAVLKINTARNLPRPLVVDAAGDCLISERGSTGTTALVFTGLRGGPSMPVAVFDAYLARRDITAIYLRDQHSAGYTAGIASLGDRLDDSISQLRRKLDQLGSQRIVTIGASVGGLGALIYGQQLQADASILYSAFISLDAAFRKQTNDSRSPKVATRAQQVAGPLCDYRNWLAQRSHAMTIDSYFGVDMVQDVAQSAALAAVTEVTRFPLDVAAQGWSIGIWSAWALIAQDKLDASLDRVFNRA